MARRNWDTATKAEKQIEWVKCSIDPVHFINNHGLAYNVMTGEQGEITCFGYQERVINEYLDKSYNIILKSRQCLKEDTFVDTPMGTRKIQELKPGDEVYSYNLKEGRMEVDKVYDAWCSGERQCSEFTLADGRSFDVGENHPFYVKGKGFVKARELSENDEILSIKKAAIVTSVRTTDVHKCYDISVDKNENFFVDGLLTHNTGLSVITAAYVAWRLMFMPNEKILILANNGIGAKRFLEYVKLFIDGLPDFLQPMNGKKEGRLKWNDTQIKFSNKSWAKSVAASPQAGRGEQLSLAILDEFAFVENDKSIWTSVGFALSVSKGDCIIISTPHGSGNEYHSNWVEAEKGTGRFNPIKVHWTENPLCSKDMRKVTINGKTTYTSPWYEEQKQKLKYDSTLIAQELDLSFLGSKLLAVDEDVINEFRHRIDVDKIEPISYFDYKFNKFTEKKTEFWVWRKPEAGAKYIIGGDVARGDGKDYSTLQVLDVQSMEQVAEFQGKIDPDMFADMIQRAAIMYNDAFVVVECNSFGLATTYKLTRRLGYKNVFYSKSIKKINVRPTDYDDFVVNQNEQIPGFQTTYQSKVMVVDSIRRAMREKAVIINSPRTMNEFSTWIMETVSEEKVIAKAERGYNDDLIMALGIALYIRETEYSNIVISKGVARAMLDAFSMSNTSLYGRQTTSAEKLLEEKEREQAASGQSGVFVYRDGGEEEDMDDLSWLMG